MKWYSLTHRLQKQCPLCDFLLPTMNAGVSNPVNNKVTRVNWLDCCDTGKAQVTSEVCHFSAFSQCKLSLFSTKDNELTGVLRHWKQEVKKSVTGAHEITSILKKVKRKRLFTIQGLELEATSTIKKRLKTIKRKEFFTPWDGKLCNTLL